MPNKDEMLKNVFRKATQVAYTEFTTARLEALFRDNPKQLEDETDEEYFRRIEETYFGAKCGDDAE